MTETNELLKGHKFNRTLKFTGRFINSGGDHIFAETESTNTDVAREFLFGEQFIAISSLPYKIQQAVNNQIIGI